MVAWRGVVPISKSPSELTMARLVMGVLHAYMWMASPLRVRVCASEWVYECGCVMGVLHACMWMVSPLRVSVSSVSVWLLMVWLTLY